MTDLRVTMREATTGKLVVAGTIQDAHTGARVRVSSGDLAVVLEMRRRHDPMTGYDMGLAFELRMAPHGCLAAFSIKPDGTLWEGAP